MGRYYSQLSASHNTIKGFTLIELIIVIALIGVLSSVVIIAINPVKQLQKGRDTQRKADIAKIQQALELYRSDAGMYPNNNLLSKCGVGNPPLQYTNPSTNSTTTYLQVIPCDPSNPASNTAYSYNSPDNYDYSIYACLENTTDTAADSPVVSCSNGYTGVKYTRTNP